MTQFILLNLVERFRRRQTDGRKRSQYHHFLNKSWGCVCKHVLFKSFLFFTCADPEGYQGVYLRNFVFVLIYRKGRELRTYHTVFLYQRKEENKEEKGRRNYFMINQHKNIVRAGIELSTWICSLCYGAGQVANKFILPINCKQ